MKRRAWLLYLGVAGSLTVVFVIGAFFHQRQGWLFNIVAMSSPVAILLGVRLHRPTYRLPWHAFALGMLLFAAGDVITYHYTFWFPRSDGLPFPSWGDPLYLAVYVCIVAGLLMLVRRRSPGRDMATLIDSVIVAVGVGVVSWTFLISQYATDASLVNIVSMAYPLGDLLLLTAVVRLAFGAGRRWPSFYLMAAGAMALFITDSIYSFISAQGIIYAQNGPLEAGWGAFYLLWGAAALHPSMRHMSERVPEQEMRITRGRLIFIGAAALIPQVVRAIQLLREQVTDLWVITISTTTLFILVVIRMAGLVRKLELSFGREKALRTAGASLLTATNREGIYGAAMEAVGTLASQAQARLLVHLDAHDRDQYLVAAASEHSDGLVGRSVDLPLTEEARTSLLAHRVTEALEVDALRLPLELPEETARALTIPLFLRGELNGLLVVGSEEPLPVSTRDGLEALSSQVALALESAALTEDLLRRQSEARFSSLVQNSSDVVMVVDADSTVHWVSPSVERVLGYASNDLGETKLTAIVHAEDKANVLQFLMNGGREGDAHPALTEFRMRHRDGFWLHVETLRTNLLHDPNVKGIVLNTRDVSERKAFEEQLAHQAFHDSVTGLANRALFKDRVEHALERQIRDDHPVSVLFMDLDDFKTINDSLGHEAGDQMLAEVGDRLKNCLRAADTAARLGGDEFAVLLEDGGEGIGAADVAARILESLEGPFHVGGKGVFCRASIGIATASQDHDGPEGAEELLRNADVAMYMAKESGKNRYQIFEPAMHDTALKRLELKADLQRALDNGEFVLHYQPVIELETGNISGLEALLRWQHPQRGLVPPLDFIPLAEETGLIVGIGNWVLREATQQGRALQERYPMTPALHMAVNLSARQLQRPEIVAEVAEALMRSGLAAGDLVLEITESIMMQDVELSLQRLTELKEVGVRLAVDDFGTGYSSLNYIQQFPVDILKVDKSFIDAFNQDARKSALTATIIKLAEDLDLSPVAEGIERADQLEQLLHLHCDLGQGYYFAKPLPLEGIDELLTTRRTLSDRDAELST